MTSNVLVTGGTGALGTAVTKTLLAEGHRVAATWVVKQQAVALEAEAANPDLSCIQADVTDPTSIRDAVEEVRSQLGPIDALVHLVGAWHGGAPVQDHTLDDWDRMLALNLTSAFLCCKAVLPEMLQRDGGRIVLVSSRTTEIDRSGQVAYAVAKAGLETLAQTIAEETRGANVTANVVAPSTLDTPANRRAMSGADTSRWVQPEEVAASIAFLLSDAAGALRGARLPLYAGV